MSRRLAAMAAMTFLGATAFLGAAFAMDAAGRTAKPNGTFRPTETLVIERDTVIRVCGTLEGTPHISGRIDSCCLILRTDAAPIGAVDIDGVDFGRYFQWEDDGVIDLEIDFKSLPAEPIDGKAKILIFTERGIIESAIATPEESK